jgi:hypothetical protein
MRSPRTSDAIDASVLRMLALDTRLQFFELLALLVNGIYYHRKGCLNLGGWVALYFVYLPHNRALAFVYELRESLYVFPQIGFGLAHDRSMSKDNTAR